MRRQRVHGMRQTDIHIVEHLFNGGDGLIDSPSDIAVNIEYSVGNVRQRVSALRDAGLIEYYDQTVGQYQLSDLGRKYINGTLSDREKASIERELLG